MKIAFVSFEYPPETGGGGIGTYLKQVHSLLKEEGHQSTIICATLQETAFWEEKDIYRIPAKNWRDFDSKLPGLFREMSWENAFDVIEGTDFGAAGLLLKKEFPNLPFVLRLHTPLYLVDKLLYEPLMGKARFRFILGALKRLKFPKLPSPPLASNYNYEFEITEKADRISSPSRSISRSMEELGFNLGEKTDLVPLPICPPKEVFEIQASPFIKSDPHIIYIGRLEKRKGVIDLAKAIPDILKQWPNAIFTFIGKASLSPNRSMDMEVYLKERLARYSGSVNFTGAIPYSEVINYLKLGDIFVFPSHYESFGIACCEAMAAGKAVIGSNAGGMAEIMSEGSGLLVDPHSPRQIAKQLLRILENNELRLSLGKQARARILNNYSAQSIIPLQIKCYEKAIAETKSNKTNDRS